MALPATDAFTNGNGTALATHNANWYANPNAPANWGLFVIDSNGVRPNSLAYDCFATWQGDSFNDDQYCQLVSVSRASGAQLGPAVRASVAARTCYAYVWTAGSGRAIRKWVNGSLTTLGSTANANANGDVFRIEVSGTTITPVYNGATDTAIGTKTDSAIASGAGGLQGYHTSASNRGDSWEAGNLGGGPPATVVPIFLHHLRQQGIS